MALKRRNRVRDRKFFRVGVAYVVAGWLIAQVVDLAADAFNAPAWFMQTLITVLLFGLPVSMFLAWAYELTPEGLMKANDVPADAGYATDGFHIVTIHDVPVF